MSHIVFASPAISCYHLQERARRELLRRGHRVTLLCSDAAAQTFWSTQVAGVEAIDLAAQPGPRQARRGEPASDAATRWLEQTRPDLVLFHGRQPGQAAIERAVRAAHSPALWTGKGLLPHTLQVDPGGLDEDASSQRWGARDFRVVAPDLPLLEACLAHALAGQEPLGLPRAPVRTPPAGRRAADAARAVLAGDVAGAWRAWRGWRAALAPPGLPAPRAIEDPATWTAPFLAVLLQPRADLRTAHGGPAPHLTDELLQRSREAADALGLSLVVALPEGADGARWRRALSRQPRPGVRLLPPQLTAVAAATAAAVVTVNHPLAAVALLAGTPVVHTGRALYHLDGVTRRAAPEALQAAVVDALRRDRPALRRRFLTWLMRYGHVWCSATHPTFNGMLGLIERIERAARASADARAASHRPGPAWPLAAKA